MRLHRSALFTGLLALGVAACGDDVQIVDPPPPPPPALNATLAPNAATIFVGQVADYGVGVSGGATGVTATWTCTSAAPAVATVVVTATGCRATGVAPGNTSINVVITKGDQTANASAGIEVNPVTTTPARISIDRLTQVIGGNIVTAPINAVQGQLDVALTLVRNTETPTLVEVLLGGVVVASQTLANQAPAEVDGEQVGEPIQLSFNTAFYTVNGTTATPRTFNGARQLAARVTVQGGTVRTATETVTLTLVNPDQIHIANLVLPTNNALDAGGQIWYGGPSSGNVSFTAIPVLFSGRTAASVFLAGGFGAGCATPGSASPGFTFSSPCASAQNSVDPVAGGFNSQATDGNAINYGAAVGAGYAVSPVVVGTNPFPVFIDKVAPAGGSLRITTQGGGVVNRENWVGGSYPYEAGYSAPGDAGVGLPVNGGRTFQVHTGSFGGTLVETGTLTSAGLANSVNNTTYYLRAQVVDRLGNQATINTTVAGGQSIANAASTSHTLTTFGVDKDAPSISRGNTDLVALQAAQSTIDLAGASYEVQGTDVVSGFAAPAVGEGLRHSHISVVGTLHSAVLSTSTVLGSGSVSATPFATSNAGTFVNTPQNAVGLYVQLPTAITSNPTNQTVPAGPAYYIYQAQVRDKAGNLSPVLTWQVYRNAGSYPQLTGLVPQGVFNGGAPAVFLATADDNGAGVPGVEVHQGSFDITYGTLGRLVYARPNPTAAVLFDDAIAIPAPVTYTAPNFLRRLQVVSAAHAPVNAVDVHIPNLITGRVYNGLNVSLAAAAQQNHQGSVGGAPGAAFEAVTGTSAQFGVPILATQVQVGTDFASVAPATAIQQWVVASYSTSAASGGNVTATITIRARGASGAFLNPFTGGAIRIVEQASAVDPYLVQLNAVTPAPNFSAPFPTLDNGIIRDFDWTFTLTRPTGSTVYLRGIGVNPGHDGLVTQGATISFAASQPAGTAPVYY